MWGACLASELGAGRQCADSRPQGPVLPPRPPLQVYVFHTATLRAVLAANEKLKGLEEQLVR